MFRTFGLAFVQLLDWRILRIVLLSVIVTLAIYTVMMVGLIWGLGYVQLAAVPWLNTLAHLGSDLAGFLLATLFFPGTVTAVMGFGQDAVADAVEARYYPDLPPPRPVPLSTVLAAGGRLLALTVILNLAMLPLYAALLFIPPLNIFAFAGVNGVLLGREYLVAAAQRRLTPREISRMWQGHRGPIWLAGVGVAIMLTVPILNLIAPVLSTAAFVHIVHRLKARDAQRKPPARVS